LLFFLIPADLLLYLSSSFHYTALTCAARHPPTRSRILHDPSLLANTFAHPLAPRRPPHSAEYPDRPKPSGDFPPLSATRAVSRSFSQNDTAP
jgi:hypothetical protein